jgi:hypothetical protein
VLAVLLTRLSFNFLCGLLQMDNEALATFAKTVEDAGGADGPLILPATRTVLQVLLLQWLYSAER